MIIQDAEDRVTIRLCALRKMTCKDHLVQTSKDCCCDFCDKVYSDIKEKLSDAVRISEAGLVQRGLLMLSVKRVRSEVPDGQTRHTKALKFSLHSCFDRRHF